MTDRFDRCADEIVHQVKISIGLTSNTKDVVRQILLVEFAELQAKARLVANDYLDDASFDEFEIGLVKEAARWILEHTEETRDGQ